MEKGKFHIKKMVAGKGCFVDIELEVEINSEDSMDVFYGDKD
jgi:hypothetical protein